MFVCWVPNPWWQQQLLNMTIEMMLKMPLPVEKLTENASDKQFGNSQAKVCDNNISENMKRRAWEAGCLLKEAYTAAPEAVRELASIRGFLDYIIGATDLGWKPYCTLEWDSAKAFIQIHNFLKRQSSGGATQLPKNVVQLLQSVQIHLRDLVVLACSRGIEPSLFRRSGIPPELGIRLEQVLGRGLRSDVSLWSSFGNSKSHIWNQDAWFHNGRGPRKGRRGEIAGAAGSSSHTAAVLPAGPAYITTTATFGFIKCSLNAD